MKKRKGYYILIFNAYDKDKSLRRTNVISVVVRASDDDSTFNEIQKITTRKYCTLQQIRYIE
jgi:hypothetical protein